MALGDPPEAGSQGTLPLGGEGTGSAGIDWSKGGAEHFQGFKESLGDLGKDKSLEPIKDFHGLTKSFINSQKMIGGSIQLPGKDAKPEDRDRAVKDILGKLRANGVLENVPESPEKYEIKMPEIITVDGKQEKFKPNEPLVNSFKQVAHKFGVTSSVAQGLFDWYLNFQEEADVQRETGIIGIQKSMKKELGGLYTTYMERARRAVATHLGIKGDDLMRKLQYNQLEIEDVKDIIMGFASVGEFILENDLITGGIPGVVTAPQVKAKIDAMMNDPKSPLNDISHRQHKEAVEEYSNLNKQYIQLGGK
jgi:hypothetical protein